MCLYVCACMCISVLVAVISGDGALVFRKLL